MPHHLVFSTVIDRRMLIGFVYIESLVVMTIRALAYYVSMRVSPYRNHGHRYGHVFTNWRLRTVPNIETRLGMSTVVVFAHWSNLRCGNFHVHGNQRCLLRNGWERTECLWFHIV